MGGLGDTIYLRIVFTQDQPWSQSGDLRTEDEPIRNPIRPFVGRGDSCGVGDRLRLRSKCKRSHAMTAPFGVTDDELDCASRVVI